MRLSFSHLVVLLTSLLLSQPALAQSKKKTVSARPAAVKAQTAKTVTVSALVEISEREREVINEINLARTNPSKYLQHLELFRTYYKGNEVHFPSGRILQTNEGTKAVDEAIAFLKAAKALPPYELRDGMVRGAKDHLADLRSTGKSGHRGSDGSLPEDRLSRYGTWTDSVGEDIVYQNWNARDSVVGLIIDDGVQNRGHRKNIFKTNFQVIGIAIGEQDKSGTMAIITFAGTFTDKSANANNPATKTAPAARKY